MKDKNMSMKEQEALKSARDSYYYALKVLKSRFEKGEDAISKDAYYSELYKENIYDTEKEIEKEQKEIEELRDSISINYLYGIEV